MGDTGRDIKLIGTLVTAVILGLAGTGLVMALDGSAERVSGEVAAFNLSDIPGEVLGEGGDLLFHLIGLNDLQVFQGERRGHGDPRERSLNLNDTELAAISGRGIPHYESPTMHLSVVLWDERPGPRWVSSGSHATKLGEEERMKRDPEHAGAASITRPDAFSPP